jgi:pyruvate formate-lyase activating enzyme-like uncharacterized protein
MRAEMRPGKPGMRIIGSENVALITGGRIARGCELCFPGLKAVVFVTGLCDDGCYYCPVSREKLGRDVFYVNEARVHSVEEAIVEVARQGARGASLTGGDPLARFERTISVIRALKENFGASFHIHLYTSGRYATPAVLKSLEKAGLDEIRFHPTRRGFEERIALAVRLTSMSVGLEIPIAPGLEKWARDLIGYADRAGADFVNLNEMEFVAPNARELLIRGYTEDPRRPHTVKGSLRAAVEVLEWAADNVSIPVHFCPASYKDTIQTFNRLRRTAALDRAWFEDRRGPLLVWGEIRGENGEALALAPPRKDLLAALTPRLGGYEAYIVEAYPTRDRRPIVLEERVYPPMED